MRGPALFLIAATMAASVAFAEDKQAVMEILVVTGVKPEASVAPETAPVVTVEDAPVELEFVGEKIEPPTLDYDVNGRKIEPIMLVTSSEPRSKI